jgi:hypothetical protein
VALLEKAAAWVQTHGREFLWEQVMINSLMSHLTGLDESDVAPYFETVGVPVSAETQDDL